MEHKFTPVADFRRVSETFQIALCMALVLIALGVVLWAVGL